MLVPEWGNNGNTINPPPRPRVHFDPVHISRTCTNLSCDDVISVKWRLATIIDKWIFFVWLWVSRMIDYKYRRCHLLNRSLERALVVQHSINKAREKNKMFVKIAILLFVVPALVFATPFSTCKCQIANDLFWLDWLFLSLIRAGGSEKKPIGVKVIPLCNRWNEICEFHLTKEMVVEMTFIPEQDSEGGTATTEVLVNGKWITLSVRPLCPKLISRGCPVTRFQRYIYRSRTALPGADVIPVGWNTIVRVRLTDDAKTTLACVQIASKFVQ